MAVRCTVNLKMAFVSSFDQVRSGWPELPGELDLAASLHLSRHTVRHALTTLAVEGLVRRSADAGRMSPIHERA